MRDMEQETLTAEEIEQLRKDIDLLKEKQNQDSK